MARSLQVARAAARARRSVEARPRECDRPTDEGCVAGLLGIRIVSSVLDDAMLLDCCRSRHRGTREPACRRCPAERTMDRPRSRPPHRRSRIPPTIRSGALAPDRETQAAARPQDPSHLAHGLFGIRYVHEAERAQHDVEARIRKLQLLGIHARELGVRDVRVRRAEASRIDHPAGQIDADDLAIRSDRLRRHAKRPDRCRRRRRARARRAAAMHSRSTRPARTPTAPATTARSRRRPSPNRSAARAVAASAPCQRRVTTTSRYSLGTTSASAPARLRPFEQLGQMSRSSIAALLGRQRGERLVHRPVPGAEYIDEVRGRTITEVEHARRARRCAAPLRRKATADALPTPHNDGDCTPAGGGSAGRCFEQLADETGGRPVGEADASAGPAHARHLGCGLGVIGREHHTEGRQHGIEAGVLEGQRLGVSHPEVTVSPSARARSAPRSSKAET